MHKTKIQVESGFFILSALYLLALPLGAANGMIVAAVIHEAAHLFICLLCRGKIQKIIFGVFGIQIQAVLLSRRCGIAATAAGPLVSLSLAVLYKSNPQVALWGVIQGVLNLLPVYPLDGGRLVRLLSCE